MLPGVIEDLLFFLVASRRLFFRFCLRLWTAPWYLDGLKPLKRLTLSERQLGPIWRTCNSTSPTSQFPRLSK